jgi:hypothetical protein
MVAIWAIYHLLEADGTTSTGKWTADKDHGGHMGHIASSGGDWTADKDHGDHMGHIASSGG